MPHPSHPFILAFFYRSFSYFHHLIFFRAGCDRDITPRTVLPRAVQRATLHEGRVQGVAHTTHSSPFFPAPNGKRKYWTPVSYRVQADLGSFCPFARLRSGTFSTRAITHRCFRVEVHEGCGILYERNSVGQHSYVRTTNRNMTDPRKR
jgi:hypothetical protein